jgi:RHS repeat-associated protein
MRRTRPIVAATVALVLALAPVPDPARAEAAPGPTRPGKPAQLASVPGYHAAARPAPTDPVAVATRPAVTWPATGTAEVGAGQSAAFAGTLPVAVAARTGAANPSAGSATVARVKVQLLDRAAATAARVDLVARLGRTDATDAAPTRVSWRYRDFAEAYGGSWAARLRLWSLPECGLTTPGKAGCQAIPLASTNDRAAGLVSADVDVSGGGILVALAAGPASGDGTYAATELKPAGEWSAGGSSGGFAWSYPLRSPPSLGGPAPEVGLAYASQLVDGQTAATNAQPSWIGEGFAWQPGSIERGYRACLDDGHPNIGDMCWGGENAVLSLNGRASPLVLETTSGAWRPADDDGSTVELVKNTPTGNGDNNGEYWKVTTTDGTQYFFGLNRLPGWTSGAAETNSVAYVPVFGNNAGEPCNQGTFAASSCAQAYRWSLDYVVDAKGNTMSYFYERELNRYARNRVDTDTPEYVRAIRVKQINYGTRQENGTDSVFAGTAPARVTFTTTMRCLVAGPSCTTAQPSNLPDVPWDQNCGGGNCANRYSPTFWTTEKLSEVVTEVASGTKTWRPVDRYRLTHELKDPGDTGAKILWLKEIEHCGLVGGTICNPPVTFNPVGMSNRVDPAGATSSIIRFRMRSITTESGGLITITYSSPECVAGSVMPSAADTNTKLCFPQYWIPPGASKPRFEYFHKYVVKEVADGELTGGSPDEVSSYRYLGDPAWHYDTSPFTPATHRTWAQWRGYQRVEETHGPANSPQSRTEYVYFRGMNGDKLSSGTRTVSITDSDGGTWPDHEWLAGQLREQITYLGTTTAVVDKTKTDPFQSEVTGRQVLLGTTLEARVIGTAATTTSTALDGGRGWRQTRTRNTFVGDRTGRLTSVDNEGDLSTPHDDQCTRYWYGGNAAGTFVTSVSRVETVAVRCAATPDRSVDVLSDVRTWFDGADSYGMPLTAGLATRTERMTAWLDSAPVYTTISRSAYDKHGRSIEESDALGRTSRLSYTPASGAPVTRTETTNAAGHLTRTDLEPAWGATLRTVDPNGRTTEMAYDQLGRLTAVWAPGRDPATALPSAAFSYALSRTSPSVLTSKRLNAAGTAQLTSYLLYDGRLRLRQEQGPAVGGGRLIAETIYDARGQVAKARPPYFNSAAPSAVLFQPTGDTAVPAQTVTVYDGVNRPVISAFQIAAVEKWRTTNAYGGDHVRTTVPQGGTATDTWFDARGQLVKLWQFHGSSPTAEYDETVRTYTKAGDLASIRDAAGTTWRYRYDQQRRKVRDEDPDKGVATYTYDVAGQETSVTDARGVTLVATYDALGRRTETRFGSPTGALRAKWTYDTLLKGQLTSSTRYENGNAYTTAVTGYTTEYQPTGTTVTVPAAEGALAGAYTTSVTYHPNGAVATRTMPAKVGATNFGGLPAETVSYGYNELGMPTTVAGTTSYVTAAEYRQDGLLSSITANDGSSRSVLQYWTYEPGTGRVLEHQTFGDFPQVVAEAVKYTYDPAGNIISVADKLARFSAGPDDTQCFGYDHLRRLTSAWTPQSGDCAITATVAAMGGPAPYLRTYTYDAAGNRIGETDHKATGTATRTLTYPAAGSNAVQPHAVASVTANALGQSRTDTYGYDAVGNTTTRPGAAGTQNLTWTEEGQVGTITEAGKTTSFTYDADGSRLIQRDAGGAAIYLAGAEYRLDAASGTVRGQRSYTHEVSGLVASREAGGGLSWHSTDHQGTSQVTVKASDFKLAKRRIAPFGTDRGTNPTWPRQYGYVGGEVDPAGTVHLGAREYDPGLGRFISADPIFDVADPQSYQGYAYANNTPISGTDSDGLRFCLEVCGGADDRAMQAQMNEQRKVEHAQYVKNKKACPRNIPREDCFGNYKPNPTSVKTTKTYKNGTVLKQYHNGQYEINGYVLPEGHPDPYKLAEATDERAPEVKRTQNGRGDFENSIRGVAVGCEAMGRGCSANFKRTVVTDVGAAHDGVLLPSYVGEESQYNGSTDLYKSNAEAAEVSGAFAAMDNATGLEKQSQQQQLASQGHYHGTGYKQHHDPVMTFATNCVIGSPVGWGAEFIVEMVETRSPKAAAKAMFNVGKVVRRVAVVGCVAGGVHSAIVH